MPVSNPEFHQDHLANLRIRLKLIQLNTANGAVMLERSRGVKGTSVRFVKEALTKAKMPPQATKLCESAVKAGIHEFTQMVAGGTPLETSPTVFFRRMLRTDISRDGDALIREMLGVLGHALSGQISEARLPSDQSSALLEGIDRYLNHLYGTVARRTADKPRTDEPCATDQEGTSGPPDNVGAQLHHHATTMFGPAPSRARLTIVMAGPDGLQALLDRLPEHDSAEVALLQAQDHVVYLHQAPWQSAPCGRAWATERQAGTGVGTSTIVAYTDSVPDDLLMTNYSPALLQARMTSLGWAPSFGPIRCSPRGSDAVSTAIPSSVLESLTPHVRKAFLEEHLHQRLLLARTLQRILMFRGTNAELALALNLSPSLLRDHLKQLRPLTRCDAITSEERHALVMLLPDLIWLWRQGRDAALQCA